MIELAWQNTNALPASQYPALVLPLVLTVVLRGKEEQVTLAHFSAAIAALASATSTIETAEQVLTQSQKDRKPATATFDTIFSAYRKVIRGLFPATSPLTQSLP
jgi:Tfp pilus assembly protein PilN